MQLPQTYKAALWLVLLLLTGLPATASAVDQTTQDMRDFGVSEVAGHSVKRLTTADFNGRIHQAAKQGEVWVKEPLYIALRFVGPELRGHTKIVEVKTPPEGRDTATITVTETGYPDDAVAGARWRLWLAKDTKGNWLIQRALWAQLCARPGQTFYRAAPCPCSDEKR
ncbi:MAG: hypothetical protein ACUVRZ_06105 [Desulfobacca sp.]|uniref:hypothetical protein n=1 Tax=Desulfobacca sp. TaxID=2067990 RepID=UPI00404A613F